MRRDRWAVAWLAAGAAILAMLNAASSSQVGPSGLAPLPEFLPVAVADKRAENSAPNVVVITLDTTRADRLGSYGYEAIETPNLDALARRGVRFANARAPVPLTLPSHATLFTGLAPYAHGVRDNGSYVLADGHHTLAERLQVAGYATGGFVSTFVLDRRFGIGQGFAHYEDDLSADVGELARPFEWQGHQRPYVDRPAGPVVRRAGHWVYDQADRPFFLWLHLFDPHHDYEPPEPFRSRYLGRPYDGEIAYADAVLGELLAALERWDLMRNTLVLVTSDHGESLGEHGIQGHGKSLYDEALHVPMLLSFPGHVPAGSVVEFPMRHVDVLPTLLDLLGLPAAGELSGESVLVRLQRGADRLPERVVADHSETMLPALRHGGDEMRAIRRGGWKLVRNLRNGAVVSQALYDIVRDPEETRDRAAGEPAVLAELGVLIDERLALEAQLAPPPAAEIDAESEEKLRRLGYIE